MFIGWQNHGFGIAYLNSAKIEILKYKIPFTKISVSKKNPKIPKHKFQGFIMGIS